MEKVGVIAERITLQNSKPDASDFKNDDVTLQDSAGHSDCRICHGAGWVYLDVPTGHVGFGKALPCRCRLADLKQERQQRMLRYCKLPEGTEQCTFESFRFEGGLRSGTGGGSG